MLEILLLVFLCKKLASMARNKGRAVGGYCTLLVFAWLGGEFAGAIIGTLMSPQRGSGFNGTAYLFALIGAAVGATLTFVLVGALSSRLPQYGSTGGFPVMPQQPRI